MKRLLNILILTIFFIPFIVSAKDFYNIEQQSLEEALTEENIPFNNLEYNKDGVTIYLFRGKGCTYCHNFLEFASTSLIKEKGSFINFVTYEVWYNSYNKELYDSVKDHFGITRDGVPLIVIGDNYLPGYASSYDSTIYKYIDEEVENGNKNDIIRKLLSGEELDKHDKKEEEEEEKIYDGDDKEYERSFIDKFKDYYEKNKTPIILGLAALVTTFFTIIIVVILLFVYKKVRKQNIVTDREIKKEKVKDK